MNPFKYDVFISYSRADDKDGWVSGLRDAIYEDFREFSSEPFRIFFDTTEVTSRRDWDLRLRQALATSQVLLVCLSPNYLRSLYCRWEWEEFARVQARRVGGGDAVAGVYFVELGAADQYDAAIATWRQQVERTQFEHLQPWFPNGLTALQEPEVRGRIKALGQGVHKKLRQAQLAEATPGNLKRHNPWFVGRVGELEALRHALTRSALAVVIPAHGIAGVGKTELAVTYAHVYAHAYQGGTWQVDGNGQTDMLEAISTLALSSELGLAVGERDLQDRRQLGRRVLARLDEFTTAARAQDADAVCLLLLDNVSEPQLLTDTQLALLNQQSRFHLVVTTRLGVGDVGAAGFRASVAMIEVGRLGGADALTLIREHQRARDSARLQPAFSGVAQKDDARLIVELLNGHALAVEQAAVYLGSSGIQPSQLLKLLRAAALDELDASLDGAQAISHEERITGAIVDQTLETLPQRARHALAVAALLPPDTIPWLWLQQLTDTTGGPSNEQLPVLVGEDWASTQRVLEGRRLLTLSDDPRYARLHRIIQEHLRRQPAGRTIQQRLDAYLGRASDELLAAATADAALLAVTATTIAGRLDEGSRDLAAAGLSLLDPVQSRLGFATAQTLAAATLTAYQRLAEADPHNTDRQRELSISLDRVGDLLAGRGDSAGALDHYTRALNIRERLGHADPRDNDWQRNLRIAERLADADPHNTDWQRDLSIRLERVGDVLDGRGDAAGALEHYTRALHIAERLIEADPHNTDRLRNLWVSLNRVGDLLAGRGETADALQHHSRALQIAERLAKADPHNTDRQRNLSISLTRVGDLMAGRGDLAGALQHHTRALHIAERLAKADPHNTDWQRNLSIRLERVADVLTGRGDAAGALQHHTRALHIAERLTETDPHNTDRQRELWISLDRVGNLMAGRGDAAGARQHHTRALHIAERLTETDPHNTDRQRNLWISLTRVADVLAGRGDAAGARQHHTRALHIAERLTETDPHNTDRQRNLWISLTRVADVLAGGGDAAEALQHHTRALHIAERLTETDPHNPDRQRELSVSLDRVGDVLAGRGDAAEALQHHTRALHIAERLTETDPHNPDWQRELSVSLDRVGDVLAGRGDAAEALQHYTRSLQIAERLNETDPHNPDRQRNLWVSLYKIASVQEDLGVPTAVDHWANAQRILAALDAAGKLPDSDRQFLHYVSGKLGSE